MTRWWLPCGQDNLQRLRGCWCFLGNIEERVDVLDAMVLNDLESISRVLEPSLTRVSWNIKPCVGNIWGLCFKTEILSPFKT